MGEYINLVPDEKMYQSGITKYIRWEYMKYPHMVIFGSTGSGKTYLLKILLGRIGKHIPDSEIIICDFKGDNDFSFADGSKNFYRFDKCMDGLEYAVNILRERQQRVSDKRNFVAFVFDEWASFIKSFDKKTADYAKKNIAVLLMLARSFNIHIILSQQRIDSSYFDSSRDNFSVVCGMGSLSKESVEMMFSSYKNEINRNKTQGHGSMIVGNQLKEIIVPKVRDIDNLNAAIMSAVERQS